MNLELVDINKKGRFYDPLKEQPEDSVSYWPLRTVRGHNGIKIVNSSKGKIYLTTMLNLGGV